MDLLQDQVKKLYLRFLLPSLGSAMVMSIYTLTDAIVIGQGVGADALAALSITTPLLCVLMAMGILFGVGGSVQMSMQRGAGKKEKANEFFTLSLVTLAVVALALWLIYGLGISVLLRVMGANDTLFPYALTYMKYINLFLPVAVFSNFIAIFVRADGDPNRAMAGVLCGGAVNIVLDIVLVFPTNVCAIFMGMTAEMNAIARIGVRLYFIAFLPMGINLLTSYYLQSVMCVKQSLTISLLRNILLSGVGILVFPLLLGGNSLWMVMPTVEIVVLLLSTTFLRQHRQRR